MIVSTLSISVSNAACPLSGNLSNNLLCLRAEAATFASAYTYQAFVAQRCQMPRQIGLCQPQAFAQFADRQFPAKQAAQDHQSVPARKRAQERFSFAGPFLQKLRRHCSEKR